jgi:hypothetical protein
MPDATLQLIPSGSREASPLTRFPRHPVPRGHILEIYAGDLPDREIHVRRHGDLQQTHQVPLNMLILRHQHKQHTAGQHCKPRRKLLTNKDLHWLSGQDMLHYSTQCRDAWSNFEDTASTLHMQGADTLHDADRHRSTPDTPTSARSVIGPNYGSAERARHQSVQVTHSLSQGCGLDKRG